MLKSLTLSLGMFLLLCAATSGQITVATNDYSPPPGTTLNFPQDVAMDGTFFNSLASGTGGPMNWDFSSRVYSSGFTNYSIAPASTPAIDSFPSGDLVLMSTVGVDTSWLVYSSVSSSFTEVGAVYHGSSAEIVTTYEDNTTDFDFPLSYNDQWTSYRHWSQSTPNTYTLNFDTSDYAVDAWGTIQYLSNSFPCLRVRCERRFTFKTYDNMDQLLDSTTQFVTTLLFVTDGFDRMVGASRVSFMSILAYSSNVMEKFTTISTDVEIVENGTVPNEYELSQNCPNPFNPSTRISLSVPTKSHVRLTVYDVLGREVAVLADRELGAGQYHVEWDGRDKTGSMASSGLYLFRMTAGDFSIAKKMILLK